MRFTPPAAQLLRDAIKDAGGVEVFAIGDVNPAGKVYDLTIHCRGTPDSVPALLSRPRAGQVVIHNHPSGNLQPSGADMALASRYGEDGVGVVIVDSPCRNDNWVVEPHRREARTVDEAQVTDFFTRRLPSLIAGHEPRSGQLQMALSVTRALNEGRIAVLEAGTGTGKSLAYLVPAALWAKENDAKVALATFTITLQNQLSTSDLPILDRAGLEVRHAVVKGRSNYLCRRRLKEAVQQNPDGVHIRAMARWAENAVEGTRHDLAFPTTEEQWDDVRSDHDQTLRARCPHYDECFYYKARRKAADAHLLVVNHALLLADLVVKHESGGEGVLPVYDRLILDEAHHLEDAATGLLRGEVTARAIRRAIQPLTANKKRPGALERLAARFGREGSPLPPDEQVRFLKEVDILHRLLPPLRNNAAGWMEILAHEGLPEGEKTLRITDEEQQGPRWRDGILPVLEEAAVDLAKVSQRLSRLEDLLSGLPPSERFQEPQPVFALGRATRLVGDKARLLAAFAEGDQREGGAWVRWLERARETEKGLPRAIVCAAPLDVGPLLRTHVFDPMKTTVLASATLTVGGSFSHYLGRHGLAAPAGRSTVAVHPHDVEAIDVDPDAEVPAGGFPKVHTESFPSPFDYARQALLVLPKDGPAPGQSGYEDYVARATAAALYVAEGGAFVLCTSYRMIDVLHARSREVLGDDVLLLRQGEMGRSRLLQRFREAGNAILFGTDSFWEGVSVKGRALRLVVIPRLPFRVPTEPVQQARHQLLEEQGRDPFRHYALPQAVLRLRQGAGRLVRTTTDRGIVMVLDQRMHDRWYGRTFIRSLPPMQRATGDTRTLLQAMRAFYREGPLPEALADATPPPTPARRTSAWPGPEDE